MEAQAFEAFIKKKGNILPPEMLLEAFKIAAEDPNSPYYQHLESQAATPRGIKSTFKDKVADLEQAVGNIENGVLLPMLTAFNNFISRERSTEIIKWSENMQEGLYKAERPRSGLRGRRNWRETFGVSGSLPKLRSRGLRSRVRLRSPL